jgi:hypothetical protein
VYRIKPTFQQTLIQKNGIQPCSTPHYSPKISFPKRPWSNELTFWCKSFVDEKICQPFKVQTPKAVAQLIQTNPNVSGPEVIAKAVVTALNARKPKRRYATPWDAKLYIFLHWLLPDWVWEKVIASALRQ